MQVEWYGQSAFRLSTPETTIFIDPFGDMSALAGARAARHGGGVSGVMFGMASRTENGEAGAVGGIVR